MGGISGAFIAAFQDRFDGRRDAHGEGRGRSVREQITEETIRAHLEGRRRLGVYTISGVDGDRCRWGCVDIDVDQWDLAVAVATRLDHYEFPAYIEKTKSKGWHVWVFFSAWVEAWRVRALLRQVVDDVSDMLTERSLGPLEVFPKQDRVPPGGLGNYVNLPLFGADAARARTCFYVRDDNGKPKLNPTWSPEAVKASREDALAAFCVENDLKPSPQRDYSLPSAGAPRRVYHEMLPCALRVYKEGTKSGSRNEWTYRLAIHFKHCGFARGEAEDILHKWNGDRNDPPLRDKEITTAVDSAFSPDGSNDSLGCENPLIVPFCAGAECVVYRQLHPDELKTADMEEEDADPGDPMRLRFVSFDKQLGEFIFARADIRYAISNLTNKSGGQRALVLIERGSEIVHRSTMNLDSDQTRRKVERAVERETHPVITGVAHDLMNVGAEIQRRLRERVIESIEDQERVRQGYVMTEAEADKTRAWIDKNPRILHNLIDATSRLGLVREKANRCLLYLLFTSRKMEKPISGIGKGDSSSGKSFLASTILSFIPPEDRHEFTRMTATALERHGEFEFQHKVLFVREAPGAEDSQGALRTLITEGDLILSTVERNEQGRHEAVDIRMRGPLSFYTTTTQLEVHAENETRYLTIPSDETEDMTRACLAPLAWQAQHGSLSIADDEYKHWHNLQRMLRTNQPVVIPFAQEIVPGFPTMQIRSRRDFAKLVELIRVCAFTHQHYREWGVVYVDNEPVRAVIASAADYAIVKGLVEGTMMRTALNIKPGQEQFLHALREVSDDALLRQRAGERVELVDILSSEDEDGGMTAWVHSPKMRQALGKTRASTYALIKALEGEGLIRVMANSKPLRVSLSEVHFDGSFLLPTISPEDLFDRYPSDRQHYYDPLEAPDFDELFLNQGS